MLRILLSGPPCSGKTTLVNQILNHKTALPFNLDLDSALSINANTIRQSTDNINPENNSLLLHYDNMRPYKRQQAFDIKLDPFLNYIHHEGNSQDSLAVITLLTPLNELTRRINERLERLSNASKLSDLRQNKLEMLSHLYTNKNLYLKQSVDWLTFTDQLNIKNHYFYINTPEKKRHFMEVNSLESKLSFLSAFYR